LKRISILGSTGSIGENALDVISKFPDKFKIIGLSAGSNKEKLIEQAKKFQPKIISIYSREDAYYLEKNLQMKGKVMYGEEGNEAVATDEEVDIVIVAIAGREAILPTYKAINKRKDIALAAKEILVSCGEYITKAAKSNKVKIIPVDSEHSAIFQCLRAENIKEVEKIILTASGGPFLNYEKERFYQITLQEALKHPSWKMGRKITIDSATLMNKGLELIEAYYFFNINSDKLDVLIHPQSIIHSLVVFCDGAVKAQMSIPDMRIPILYALSYPKRLPLDLPALDLTKINNLSFLKPDEQKFPCLKLAKEALHQGNSMTTILNAANDIAVKAFLEEKIPFIAIPKIVEKALEYFDNHKVQTIEEALQLDKEVRAYTENVFIPLFTKNYIT